MRQYKADAVFAVVVLLLMLIAYYSLEAYNIIFTVIAVPAIHTCIRLLFDLKKK